MRLIGTMSGTSADGVDAALVEVNQDWPRPAVRLLGHHAHAYPAALKRRLFAVRGGCEVSLAALAALARDISLEYALAVEGLLADGGCRAEEIAAIAAHGQTLFHQPPMTIQWLDPALLARRTGCRVISDFRRADCAVGGQGAPLVPFADWVLFADDREDRILLNLGGIANVTCLPAGGAIEQVIAFDTGPANCLSDWLCRTHDPDGPGYDAGGARAGRGSVVQEMGERFLADAYFKSRPPKSTDGPEMIRIFERAGATALGRVDLAALNDLLATAAFVAARVIVDAAAPWSAGRWIVSGGGIHNQAIMDQLRSMLPAEANLQTTDAFGMPSQAREAAAFALLGAATLAGVPSNVPSATGAAGPAILGTITPGPPR